MIYLVLATAMSSAVLGTVASAAPAQGRQCGGLAVEHWFGASAVAVLPRGAGMGPRGVGGVPGLVG